MADGGSSAGPAAAASASAVTSPEASEDFLPRFFLRPNPKLGSSRFGSLPGASGSVGMSRILPLAARPGGHPVVGRLAEDPDAGCCSSSSVGSARD
ncbi:hypothetical protein EFL26_10295 [Nocardioides pocheonensis]|uniref:Uncharacterized protein n=1 Tax=Nocardioides pocheonensis TaxID=661485 RepID=A0A3N0GR18_9ACTN|nr:hypothetical protein EFL26_10295 [Nocardioides pocheonensis]